MPISSAHTSDPAIVGPLGSLAMSRVTPRVSTLALRARTWQRDLDRLGLTVPFAFLHDFGLLFASSRDQWTLGPRCDFSTLVGVEPGLIATYQAILEDMAESDAARRSGELKMSDVLVVALLAKLLGPIAQRVTLPRPYGVDLPAETAIFELTDLDLTALWAKFHDRRFEVDALRKLVSCRLGLLTLVDALDVDTLRLLGMLGDPASAGAMAQVDLLRALANPNARDIVSFSLELLPSVLETKARPGASSHAAFGYSGLGRRGSLDSLVLTELAWDQEEFLRRVIDEEVFYYARDQARDQAKRQHLLLIDASASMRGERSTFARGLALATAKKLVLSGEDVVFRFFDSRLYEPLRGRGRELPTSQVLAFRGERGRNPVRVFSSLANELALTSSREGRDVFVHVFTHGAHDIPRNVVAALLEHARLSAVFVAPQGGDIDLDYLPLLDAYWVVTHETLADKNARAEAARSILVDDEVPAEARSSRSSLT
ncbi:MAG: hypothetical protein RMJ98_17180 [Myxococcales bacterium]|nr:hypothetical protein [Polyangiaceae bacterium]MDW8251030.1 hypothetical protein [Myxococcales bacterium]